jgi:hypothetical protein
MTTKTEKDQEIKAAILEVVKTAKIISINDLTYLLFHTRKFYISKKNLLKHLKQLEKEGLSRFTDTYSTLIIYMDQKERENSVYDLLGEN